MSDSETLQPSEEQNPIDASSTALSAESPDAEAVAAHAAITEAVEFANASISAGEAGDAKPIERKQLTREERQAMSRKIARRQRELGTRELERKYPNTIVVPAGIAIGDPNIASSAVRFLGLTDRTLHLLHRYGQRFMGATEVAKVHESMDNAIRKYVEEASQALSLGRSLTEKAKLASANSGDPWFAPEYTSTTLEVTFGVKTRQALNLVRALQQWDLAIVEFAALDFNGEGDIDQIDTLRQNERRLFGDISRLCLRVIQSVNRRSQAMARPAPKEEGEGQAEATEAANGAPEAA
ncbi:hypothetical protein [Hydrogenophaga sp. NFH-34]|uniref:hypothetical protein n=1 Tax=Hydrogenophaga sp. NFH-34 TaxID=2744446 RepID=UPI001F3A51DE|nr:hypothetical protein [Hydrogenophaga sp. NFH-34]